MTCHDCGCSCDCVSNDGKEENLCFSKTAEVTSSSQFYTVADGSNLDYNSDYEFDQVSQSRSGSSVGDTDCVIDIENGVEEVRISVEKMERECRICMMSLDSESGIAIELGCSCKDGMEAAHRHCAETWFRSKGNKICEVCNSIAQNIVGTNVIESRKQQQQISAADEVSFFPAVNPNNSKCIACKLCLFILVLFTCFAIFLLISNRVKPS
ncbi:uncharacterized protein LOC141688788 [Apium graveolens]|uniref:uncharacterized protein LOC141688788 n=1 Tax=Apium graveolens TaxID=4045 RepID=UPI003D7B8F16